eukprot:747822-Hanusia_phi.AAC.7
MQRVRNEEDTIPQGIGYYSGTSVNGQWMIPLASLPEAKGEGHVIPGGLNYYKGATEEYDQDYLRDPTYFDQAYRLAYPKLPDQDNRAKFFDDKIACTASGEPLRC